MRRTLQDITKTQQSITSDSSPDVSTLTDRERDVLLPRDGYFQLVSRLTAALAQLVPLSTAPYLFNLMALLWQILPAAYLVSSRFATLIPSLSARLLLAFAYLALPNSSEVHVNIT